MKQVIIDYKVTEFTIQSLLHRTMSLSKIPFSRMEDRLIIYLQAHELFTENLSRKYVFHGNGHTFQYFLLLSGSTAIVLYDDVYF